MTSRAWPREKTSFMDNKKLVDAIIFGSLEYGKGGQEKRPKK